MGEREELIQALAEKILQLRAELGRANERVEWSRRAEYAEREGALKAEAALARVRKLCASPIDERVWSHEVYAAVLRALDGPE